MVNLCVTLFCNFQASCKCIIMFSEFKKIRKIKKKKGQVPGERYCAMEIFVQKVYQEEQGRHNACKGQGGKVG